MDVSYVILNQADTGLLFHTLSVMITRMIDHWTEQQNLLRKKQESFIADLQNFRNQTELIKTPNTLLNSTDDNNEESKTANDNESALIEEEEACQHKNQMMDYYEVAEELSKNQSTKDVCQAVQNFYLRFLLNATNQRQEVLDSQTSSVKMTVF